MAAQQQVQQALENQPLHVHRLGHQPQLAQSPAVQAINTTRGLSFLDVTDEDILRLTRPAGTYQQLVQRFQERHGEALDGKLKICFLTAENLREAEMPSRLPILRRLLAACSRHEVRNGTLDRARDDLLQNRAAHFYGGEKRRTNHSTITVELPRGSIGTRLQGLSDAKEPYAMTVTSSKLLRSRSLFLTTQIAHEIGHAVFTAQETYNWPHGDEPEADYAGHMEECYADAMSVYVAAQMHGQRGLDYVQYDRELRALSIQNGAKYYTCPTMDAAIADAQQLLDTGDLEQMPLGDLGDAAYEVWYRSVPTPEQFNELKAQQKSFGEAIAAADDFEDVQHPLRPLCEQAWANLAEEFEPAEELSRQEVLQQYYNEVSQSLRGYGSREKQLEALQGVDAELTAEADLNQQMIGRDDLDLDELEPGELQIAERRTILQRLQHVIERDIRQPAHSR